tara:strand:- start:389 stop:544 length:156 start_codon:yes stop_codon:yes gene_type:complete
MNSTVSPSVVGITGLALNISLEQINTLIAIAVGCSTLLYMILKIAQTLKKK